MTDKPFKEIVDEIAARSFGREVHKVILEIMEAFAAEMDRRYPPQK